MDLDTDDSADNIINGIKSLRRKADLNPEKTC